MTGLFIFLISAVLIALVYFANGSTLKNPEVESDFKEIAKRVRKNIWWTIKIRAVFLVFGLIILIVAFLLGY